ncbi:MAG: hypothetical protein KDA85_16455 [Planctomycetaceae bacterium]|nr:hypothetical protein [Planctomycetaceae bacterium]
MPSSIMGCFRKKILALCVLTGLLVLPGASADEIQAVISGDASIRGPYADSEIVVTTTSRLAGAIDSVTWRGQEFINSTDHGRQLQSASNLDAGSTFTGETFNPTEAGSRHDGAGAVSTSRLLHLVARGNQLQTTTQMAFWLRPGETSGGHPAKNLTKLSDHLLTKRVTIGYRNLPNVLQYDVTFSLPVGEQHRFAQFEAVTGYMPPKFSRFEVWNPESNELLPLSDGPGEQPLPVVFSTPDDQFAVGIWSPMQPSPGFERAGYGRWRFTAQRVVKWNCVFRVRGQGGPVEAGDYAFRCFVVLGTREDVRQTLKKLLNLDSPAKAQ